MKELHKGLRELMFISKIIFKSRCGFCHFFFPDSGRVSTTCWQRGLSVRGWQNILQSGNTAGEPKALSRVVWYTGQGSKKTWVKSVSVIFTDIMDTIPQNLMGEGTIFDLLDHRRYSLIFFSQTKYLLNADTQDSQQTNKVSKSSISAIGKR